MICRMHLYEARLCRRVVTQDERFVSFSLFTLSSLMDFLVSAFLHPHTNNVHCVYGNEVRCSKDVVPFVLSKHILLI